METWRCASHERELCLTCLREFGLDFSRVPGANVAYLAQSLCWVNNWRPSTVEIRAPFDFVSAVFRGEQRSRMENDENGEPTLMFPSPIGDFKLRVVRGMKCVEVYRLDELLFRAEVSQHEFP